MTPGNHVDFSDVDRMREWTFGQVARFGAACRIFAPLYRQMTFGTYFGSDEEHEHRFAFAYADAKTFSWKGDIGSGKALFEADFGTGRTTLPAAVSLLSPEAALSEAMFF